MTILLVIIFTIQIATLILVILLSGKNKNKELSGITSVLSNLEKSIDKISNLLSSELAINREEFHKNARELREETQKTFTLFQDSFSSRMTESLNQIRKQLSDDAKDNRSELTTGLSSFEQRFSANVKDFNELQKQKFDSLITNLSDLSKEIEQRLERLRNTIEEQLKSLQTENSKKLDEMRNVVDEKLQTTLEKRLGESFKQVSERLEQVHQGLGDMKNLATGVGDLKKVLSNVKKRGMLGEYQLAHLLSQMLNPEQYEANVKCKDDKDFRVEYVIKLPGRDDDMKQVYLPIDAKFPIEDYYKLQEAYDSGDTALIDATRKSLAATIKQSARDISEKYINPPVTTDFAIMFVPLEGLFAEIIGRTGLFEQIQRDYRVVISGPTTLGALLNSLQMGFKTFAIQRRSSQVWQLLGDVKSEFGKFGTVLQDAQKNILGAGKKLDDLIGTRTRAIERKLRDVEELPAQPDKLLTEELTAEIEED